MLVPRNRLIMWTAGIVVPFAILAGTIPSAAGIAAFFIGLFAAAAIADAILAPGMLAGLRVDLPAVVRLQNGRAGTIAVHLHNSSSRMRMVRLGIAFPREIESPDADRFVRLPEGVEESVTSWPCTPNRRGQYFLRHVYVEAASPLGFWSIRGQRNTACELRVYPDLLSERGQVASLFLRRAEIGVHAHRHAGQGREFEKLREFVPGDSLSDIHWKASAKRGRPVTKIFQIERSHEVYVVIDASRLSARKVKIPVAESLAAGLVEGEQKSTPDLVETTTLERYVTAALLLALAAERQGDQFGIITFGDRVLDFVRARNGQSHFDACRDRLYTLHSQDVSPDFEELCTFIRLRLRKRALLVFLTALDDPVLAESFTKAADLICRQQLLLVNMLQPETAQPLFAEGNPVTQVDDLYRRLGGHLQWNSLRELQRVLQRRGMRLSFLDPAKISAQLIAQHAEVRARQLL